jgi:WhiB family redox-sensing transcriptional regulator
MPSRENAARTQHAELRTPPLTEIAAQIRDGESYRDLATEYRVDQQGLANRLRNGGYRFDTGETERAARLREMKERLSASLRTYSEPWMADAICAQTDPDAFFPEKGGSTAEAKRVCFSCPVSEVCLEWALVKGERFGIYGGKSERERRAITKQRKAAA